MKRRTNSNVRRIAKLNQGALSDIAFLLLIFFLVATSVRPNKGIRQKVPPPCLSKDCEQELLKSQVFSFDIYGENQFSINSLPIREPELIEQLKSFLAATNQGKSHYIKISIQPTTSYGTYMHVQDFLKSEIEKHQNHIAVLVYGKNQSQLSVDQKAKVKQRLALHLIENLVDAK